MRAHHLAALAAVATLGVAGCGQKTESDKVRDVAVTVLTEMKAGHIGKACALTTDPEACIHTSDGEIQKRRAEMLSVDAYRNAKVEFKTIGGDRLARLDVKGTDRVFFTFIDGKMAPRADGLAALEGPLHHLS